LLDSDLVYVGGGNTANLLAVWKTHGVDVILRDALDAGGVVAGTSAGAMCWFQAGIKDSFGGGFVPIDDGLGVLPGAFCPHFSSEGTRQEMFRD
jgi:dipeptidase E